MANVKSSSSFTFAEADQIRPDAWRADAWLAPKTSTASSAMAVLASGRSLVFTAPFGPIDQVPSLSGKRSSLTAIAICRVPPNRRAESKAARSRGRIQLSSRCPDIAKVRGLRRSSGNGSSIGRDGKTARCRISCVKRWPIRPRHASSSWATRSSTITVRCEDVNQLSDGSIWKRRISGSTYQSYEELSSKILDANGDTIISISEYSTITLYGVTSADLTNLNFSFAA